MVTTVSEECTRQILALQEKEKDEINALKQEKQRLLKFIDNMKEEKNSLQTQVNYTMSRQMSPSGSWMHFIHPISHLPASRPLVPVEVLEQALNIWHSSDTGSWPTPEDILFPRDRLCCRHQKSSLVSLVSSSSSSVTFEGGEEINAFLVLMFYVLT